MLIRVCVRGARQKVIQANNKENGTGEKQAKPENCKELFFFWTIYIFHSLVLFNIAVIPILGFAT